MSAPASGLATLMRKSAKVIIGLAFAIVGLVIVYLASAVIGTVWTAGGKANAGSGQTTTVFVLSNGFHSDIALPVKAGQPSAGLPVASGDLPGGLQDTRYLIIGWGSQTAYTSLLALSDLTAAIAFKALLFDQSVMHVLPYSGELRGKGVYRLQLDDAQYGRLVGFIAQTFKTGDDGSAELIPGISQGFGDVFYRARPRFSLFYGCNAWTGEALRNAGVPVGQWTPFAQSIEWNMGRISQAPHFDSDV